ncbi:hypothetical protein ACFO4N_12370 [Camelliibacillus cellulosilyticus]|uniref:Activator of Hsp90 ATPase-like protein n=1 Tax=Camelliibacillus cellulosilyticus TaxID=2174486 RepID=A0ABV9GMQ3_9BACL
MRLTWQKPEWTRPSTVQVRILPKDNGKTTISFHQEHLADPLVREDMKVYWENALIALKERALCL